MSIDDRFENMPEEELARWALANGWEVDRTILFDEEGVEGWCWTKGSVEGFCIADGDSPVVGAPANIYVAADLRAIPDIVEPVDQPILTSLAPSARPRP